MRILMKGCSGVGLGFGSSGQARIILEYYAVDDDWGFLLTTRELHAHLCLIKLMSPPLQISVLLVTISSLQNGSYLCCLRMMRRLH